MGLSAVIWAIEGTTYPALSSMEDGRKRFVWRTIKVSLIILLPISFAIIFYSTDITQLFGYSYSEGAPALQILLLSVVPNAVMNGIGILTYAYGNYRHVLIIGIASTVPRLLLYFVFVPWFGGTGAALSYTLGAIFGFIASVVISKRIGLIIRWKEIVLMAAVPLMLALLFSSLNVHFVLGIMLSILISYVIYLKLMLIDRKDVRDYLYILPVNIANPLIRMVDSIAKKINGRY
jgi:O-antigen/teichoic acid export membrane protein